MIYLFDKDERLIKIIRKPAIKTALQKYSLTKERYVSDRLTVEMKALNDDELEKIEYMAIQTMEDAHTFHYFYVAQKSSDQLTTLIGVQSGIEELRKSPVFDKRPQNALAREVINDLLSGTNWQARFVGETTPHSTNFYYISIFDALKKVCEVWDLEMQFFVEMNGNRIGARYIDFKRKIGQAVGKRVVYGHNALQILQEVERTNIFTALVGRGKGEQVSSAEDSGKQANGFGRKITFEDVVWSTAGGKPVNKPKGQKYVELPAMTKLYGIKNADGSMRPKIGFVDFAEEENPEQLLERTYKALVNAARPQLALKTSSVYLRGAKVGDTIRVVRHDKKLDYDTRIFDITFNRLNDQSSDIKLGDRIGESNEAKAQTIADKAIDEFVANEFSNFVKNLPDYLPTADGFNNNWYGSEDPTVKYQGKVLINDIWYKPDPEHEGHKIMLRWTGEVWEEILRTFSSEALRAKISGEIEKLDKAMKASDLALKEQTTQALRTASANASAIEAAKGAITKLNQDLTGAKQTSQAAIDRLKSDFASAQRTANDQTALLRSDLANIRTKQGQHETEIGKQVAALNATKTELAGVKTAQATFEQSTTRRLAELTNVADGKASKSELVQTADELKSRIASVQTGSSRNYFRNSRLRTFTTDSQATYDYRLFIAPDFWKNKDRLKRDYVRLSFDVTFPVALARDTQANVHFSAHPWYAYRNLVFKGGTVERQHFEFTIDLSGAAETYQTNNIFIRFGTNYGFPAGLQVVIENAMLSVGNYYPAYQPAYEDQDERVTAVESTFKQRADSLEVGVSRLTEGLKTKADSSALTLLSDRILASVKSLETDTQNKLNQKLSTAEFEVRAGSIRQEIIAATKDKADKALVTAEAGRLREELASLQVGENLFINSEFKNLRDNNQRYTANGKTYQNMIAPYWYNPYNAGLPNAQNIQHGYFDTETFSETVFVFNESDGSRNWKALPTDFKIGVITAGEYYFSADLYATDLGTHIKFGFYYHNSTGKLNFYAGQTKIEVKEKGSWVRLGAPLKVNDDIDLTKKVQFYIYGYNFTSNSILYLKNPKVSKGRLKSDWSPALEDTEGLITEAKATFERTAQGLRTDLTAVQRYVSADGTRAEALRTYSREEAARQLTAERKLIESGYVAKAQHTEDVQGLTRRFEELKTSSETKLAEYSQTVDGQLANVQAAINTASSSLTSFNNWKQSAQETLNKVGKVETGLNETKTSLAEFKRTAEGQLTTITQQVAGKASQTEFQRVQETSKLYERLIGSTEKEVTDKVSRMVMTNQLFQIEVSKNQGLRTVQSQLAGSWSIKNLNSASDILGQLNLNPDGSVSINEGLISIGDKTHIKNGVIKNAMIESMLADKITAGTLNAANVNIVNLNANKIVGLDANFIKSKIELAFIEWMRGKVISAQNDAMQINLNDGHVLFYNDDASIKRVLAGYPTQFIRYENKQENGQNHGRTIIGSNRSGSNAWKSASFAGLVIDNNSNNSVDKIYQFGDYNYFRHAQGDDGWNFSVVTQTITPGLWTKNSEIWARHFVVPRETRSDTDNPTKFIRLEESVAAIWDILNHAASGQVTMTQAMKNLINSRKAAWNIVRNVG
ncbi:phage tail spike protein [Streptococcus cristatus]